MQVLGIDFGNVTNLWEENQGIVLWGLNKAGVRDSLMVMKITSF